MKISNEMVKMPDVTSEQRGEVKIEGRNEEITVKNSETGIKAIDTKLLKSIGIGLPPEIKQVLAELYEKGMTVDKDALLALKMYMDKFVGTLQEKIEVLKALIGKGLDINLTNLKAVHEALYGEDISKIIKDLGINIEGKEHVEEINDISIVIDKIRNFISEDMGKRILTKALDEVSREIEQDRPKLSDKGEEDYVKTALASVALSGKDYMVTEVTKRLNTAAQNFKELKMEIAKSLDTVSRYIKGESRPEIIGAENILEKTIEILDKGILKSDITLFTDMETEKELVRASSDLTKAKEFLQKGEYEKAWKLTEKVKDVFEKINWKPSNTKVVHFANMRQSIEEAMNDREKLNAAVKNMGKSFSQNQHSGRMVYEALRLLGADHEGETARYLAGEDIPKESVNNNIKSILLKLMEKEQDPSQKGSSLSVMADKITGQQLMSRSDKGQLQTMFFSLPILIGGSLQDVKLYINSKKEKEKLDWQNCSIFFLIKTKKLGETGILLQSSGRNLNITVKNDRNDLEEKVKPLFVSFKENLTKLGYEVGNMAFAKLSNKTHESSINEKITSPMTKGFDARI